MRAFFRSVFFLPTACSYVVASLVWKLSIFNGVRFGLANTVLGWFGIDNIPWLATTDPPWYWLVIVTVRLWLQIGLLHDLVPGRSPAHLPRAVRGGRRGRRPTGWQTFRYITFPQFRATSVAVLLLLLINAYQAFDEFFNLLGNSSFARPPLVYLYYTAQGNQDYGHGTRRCRHPGSADHDRDPGPGPDLRLREGRMSAPTSDRSRRTAQQELARRGDAVTMTRTGYRPGVALPGARDLGGVVPAAVLPDCPQRVVQSTPESPRRLDPLPDDDPLGELPRAVHRSVGEHRAQPGNSAIVAVLQTAGQLLILLDGRLRAGANPVPLGDPDLLRRAGDPDDPAGRDVHPLVHHRLAVALGGHLARNHRARAVLRFHHVLVPAVLPHLSAQLEEAARVDGLGYFGAFWRIVVPNRVPSSRPSPLSPSSRAGTPSCGHW